MCHTLSQLNLCWINCFHTTISRKTIKTGCVSILEARILHIFIPKGYNSFNSLVNVYCLCDKILENWKNTYLRFSYLIRLGFLSLNHLSNIYEKGMMRKISELFKNKLPQFIQKKFGVSPEFLQVGFLK